MSKLVVLLRGINVGGHNILPMKELVEILERIGCTNVKTYIQSGNIVLDYKFDKDQLGSKIKSMIMEVKGFEISPLVLSREAFASAIKGNPYHTENGKLLHLFFLAADSLNPEISILEKYQSESEQYELKGRVLYLHAPDGIARSKLAVKIEKAIGVPVTARNWNTVQKLAALAGIL